MIRNVVLRNIIEGVLQGPIGKGVELRESFPNRGVVGQVDVCTFESLPTGTSVDHEVSSQDLETTLEGLNLTNLVICHIVVILLDILFPEVSSIFSVIPSLLKS